MEVAIIDAVRTPFARSGGSLKGWHPVELLAATINATVTRSAVAPTDVDRVLAACANPVGEHALNIARSAVLAAGWPDAVTGVTLDSQLTSGIDAIQQAAALIGSGQLDVIVACGVDSASRVPAGASTGVAVGHPYGKTLHDRYADRGGLVPPGITAELLAKRYKLSRKKLDDHARNSIEKAELANKNGLFEKALLALPIRNARGIDTASNVSQDEVAGVIEALAPLFETDGIVTAQTFAQPADGACALLLADAGNVDAHLARVIAFASRGNDAIRGDSGADVVRLALEKANVDLGDVGRIEMLEDSAPAAIALQKDLGVDASIVNPDGGALARGLPVGAAGVALVADLAYGMIRSNIDLGVAVVAGSNGQASAVVLAH